MFEQEGMKVDTLSESSTKIEVESSLELDYFIGVENEKVFSTKLNATNCQSSVTLSAALILLEGLPA